MRRRRVGAGAGAGTGSLERLGHRDGALVPISGVLGERALDDRFERPRGPAWERRRLHLHVLERDLDRRLTAERRAPGEHLVEHDAGAVHVGGGRHRQPARLLGRHVARRADNRGGPAVGAALGQARDPEIADLDPASVRDEDVGGLDVAVHDVLGVRVLERAAQLLGHLAGLPGGERAAALQARRQALALDQLGDEVQALLGLPDVEDLHDPRIADARQELRLALEALGSVGILGPPRLDHLDRDGACQPPVVAAIHPAERALADQLVELVAAVEGAAGQIRGVGHQAVRPPGPSSAPG